MKPVALIAFLLATTSAPAAPDLILAETWQGQDVRGWAMSDKEEEQGRAVQCGFPGW